MRVGCSHVAKDTEIICMQSLTYIKAASKGFSLIEVLVTFVVLSIGLMGIARFQATMQQGNTLAKERTEAAMLAQKKMEQFRSYRSTAVSASEFDYGDIFSSSSATKETINGTNAVYTREWEVIPTVVNAAYQYKTITVTVTWPPHPGTSVADAKVFLRSIISNTNPRYSAEIN